MTLREIFLELGELFDFEYEKNRNGTYRVNTIIRQLVYPELYTSQAFKANTICYYLAHPELSYQNEPNIRNSFSELMHPKDNSNRFPIVEFCEQIDIQKMYQYYETLISTLADSRPSSYQRLLQFLDKISAQNPILQAKLKLICNCNSEYLTWIILYAMFNAETANQKFQSTLQIGKAGISEISISESGSRHKLSIVLHQKKKQLNRMVFTLILLSGFQLFLSLIPYLVPAEQLHLTGISDSMFYLALMIFSLILILLWKRHAGLAQQYSDLQTYHDYMHVFPSFTEDSKPKAYRHFRILPFQDDSQSSSFRRRFRRIHTPITIGLCLIMSIFSYLIHSFPFLIAVISFLLLSEVYIDSIVFNYRYRCFYDSLSEPEGTRLNPYRGLAKLYQWEYQKTGFHLKDDYYQTIVHIHSGTCYQHIFFIAYDRIKYNLFYRHNFFLYFNCCILILEVLQLMTGNITSYLRIPGITGFHLFISIYLIALGIFNITAILFDASSFHNLSLLAMGSRYASENPPEAERLFLTLQAHGIINDTDWGRGIFTYNIGLFEQGERAETIIPESDRMQFYHRVLSLRSLTGFTIFTVYLLLVSLFVWHFNCIYLLLPFTLTAIIAYPVIKYFCVDKIHKQRIIREIKKLMYRSSSEKASSNTEHPEIPEE